jgi:hypothetical protein
MLITVHTSRVKPRMPPQQIEDEGSAHTDPLQAHVRCDDSNMTRGLRGGTGCGGGECKTCKTLDEGGGKVTGKRTRRGGWGEGGYE